MGKDDGVDSIMDNGYQAASRARLQLPADLGQSADVNEYPYIHPVPSISELLGLDLLQDTHSHGRQQGETDEQTDPNLRRENRFHPPGAPNARYSAEHEYSSLDSFRSQAAPALPGQTAEDHVSTYGVSKSTPGPAADIKSPATGSATGVERTEGSLKTRGTGGHGCWKCPAVLALIFLVCCIGLAAALVVVLVTQNTGSMSATPTCQTTSPVPPPTIRQTPTVHLTASRTGAIQFNISGVTEPKLLVRLSRDGELIHILSLSGGQAHVNDSHVNIRAQLISDGLRVLVTFNDVTCEDEGAYIIQAESNRTAANQTVEVFVDKMAEVPIIDLPAELVENRSVTNPVCFTFDLGSNPTAQFEWILQRADGGQEVFPKKRFSETIVRNGCTKRGNSSLQANRYVTWNGSKLCCQLTSKSSVLAQTCRPLLFVPPVKMTTPFPVLQTNDCAHFMCLARNDSRNVKVDLYQGSSWLVSYNHSTPESQQGRQGTAVAADFANGALNVTWTVCNVTCADGGHYSCVVTDAGVVTSDSTSVTINGLATTDPKVTVPLDGCPAEGYTQINPTCDVESSGSVRLRWVLMHANGSKVSFPVVNTPEVANSSQCDRPIASNVTFNAQLYWGWNQSRLCCQVVHPSSGAVLREGCSNPILLIPHDYCSSNSQQYLPHPYRNNWWVQCFDDVIYPNGQCAIGVCWDQNTKTCSRLCAG